MSNDTVKMLTASAAVRQVSVDSLQVDESYQRGVSGGHKKIVADFDPNAFGVPLVGQREDGSLWIVDGLQRITAWKKLNRPGTVRVNVFVSRGPEHEAQIFKLVNKDRTKVSVRDLFKALLAAGDKDAWALKEAVEAAGFKLAHTRHPSSRQGGDWRYISGINGLERVFKMIGRDGLVAILKVVEESWPSDPMATNHHVLEGLGVFWRNTKGLVDVERLVARLRTTTPSKLIYSAGLGIGGRSENMAEAVAKIYRKRLSSKKTAE